MRGDLEGALETADDALTQAELVFLAAARSAVLGTVTADGRPRLVPICFAFEAAEARLRIWTPLDDKPKRVADPHALDHRFVLVALNVGGSPSEAQLATTAPTFTP